MPTARARVWTACRARSSRFPPPALSATTSKRCGAPSTTSIAWVPMEPVDPRRTILRGCMVPVSRTAFCARGRAELGMSRQCSRETLAVEVPRTRRHGRMLPRLVAPDGRALTPRTAGVTWGSWSGRPGLTRRSTSSPGRCCSAASPPSTWWPSCPRSTSFRPSSASAGCCRCRSSWHASAPCAGPPCSAGATRTGCCAPSAGAGWRLPPRLSWACRSLARRGFPCWRSWPCGCCTCRSSMWGKRSMASAGRCCCSRPDSLWPSSAPTRLPRRGPS